MSIIGMLTLPPSDITSAVTIKLEPNNIKNGSIRICLVNNAQDFPDKCTIGKVFDIQPNGLYTIGEVKSGKWAVSVFHDADNSTKLEKNFMGIPKEAYGFSNNPKILFSAPSFAECVVTIPSAKPIVIKLNG